MCPVSPAWLPSSKTFSVSTLRASLCAAGGGGSATSSSVGRRTPWTSVRGAVDRPSMKSGPKIPDVTCGWAGNTCTGCEPTSVLAFGLTETVIVIGWFQLVLSKTTQGGVDPDTVSVTHAESPAAWKRLSADDTSVLPSSRRLTTTGAVGGIVSCIV